MANSMKLKWKGRKRAGRDTGGRKDLHRVQLKPDPILRDLTLDVAEEGLRLIGVDLADLIDGRPVGPEPPIELDKGRRFLEAVLVNHAEYNLRAMPFDVAGTFLAILAANFFFHASMLVKGPRSIRIGSWSKEDSGSPGLGGVMLARIHQLLSESEHTSGGS